MKLGKLATLATAISLSFAATAENSNAPDASQLVGQVYGGVNYTYFKADDERYNFINVPASSLDAGDGFGGQIGYRFSELNELRIEFSDLKIDTHQDGFGEENGSSVAIDVLHFPSKQNLYLVGGFKDINMNKGEVSANAGMGYRHYFSTRLATYVEGKMHYQLEEEFVDFTTSVGLIYFFGENKAKGPKLAQTSAVAKPSAQAKAKASSAPVVKDSDGDGIVDGKDQCANTPRTHMVDNQGCTVFSKKTQSMRLDVKFANNSAEINADYLTQIRNAASFMKKYPDVDLTIEGHSSAVGSAGYNKTLSLKRAQAVVDTLVNDFGIDEDRLNAVGYGEERLLNTGTSEQAHAENRRIMATLTAKEKVPVNKY